MASSSKKLKLPEKREGSHGSFMKSCNYINSNSARRKQEKAFLNSMTRVISEMKTRTRTPCIMMAFSDGQIVASASTPELQSFINKDSIQEGFLSFCARSTSSYNEEVDEEPPEPAKEVFDYDGDEFELNDDWPLLNMHDKRALVCRLVSWSKKSKSISWKPSDVPIWWPSNYSFKSPHCKSQSRADTSELHVIIESFFKFHGVQLLAKFERIIERIALCQDKDQMKSLCVEKCEEMLQFLPYVPMNSLENINHSHLALCKFNATPTSTSRKPVYGVHCYAKATSLALFNTTKKKRLLQMLSACYNLTYILDVVQMLQKGWLNFTSEKLVEQLDIDNFDESIIESHILNTINGDKADIICFYGIVKILQLKVEFVFEGSIEFQCFDGKSSNKIQLMFDQDGSLKYPLVEIKDSLDITDLQAICILNENCLNVEAESFVCKYCRLGYHKVCIGETLQDCCGCHLVYELDKELRLLQDHKGLMNKLEQASTIFFAWARHIILNEETLFRIKLIRDWSALSKARLSKANEAYEKIIPVKCRRLIYTFTEHCERKYSNVIKEKFPNVESDILAHDVLFPEICKCIIQHFGRFKILNNLSIERYIQYAAIQDSA